jgi:hypothetical protein
MSRMKLMVAPLLAVMIVAFVPAASATGPIVEIVASGATSMWQTMALAAFNAGQCPASKVKLTPPCFHYTSSSSVNFNLTDTRPTRVSSTRGGPGVAAVDSGAIWIVWDSAASPHVFAFVKVDSVVGLRCFFANPSCVVSTPSNTFPAAGDQISPALWGSDSTPPTSIQTLFIDGVTVNSAATDIRPEDALFAACRVNSALGNGTPGFGDGLDGLGYNANNPAGTCPAYNKKSNALSQLVGSQIVSGYPVSPSVPVNVLAFNISGKDPFTNSTVQSYTTYSAGASPIVFVFQRSGSEPSGGLTGFTNATDTQLQTAFSGTNCDANAVFGLGSSPNPIAAYLRDPLSGTYNTAEATTFRRPTETIPSDAVIGVSQETNVGFTNPLRSTPCANSVGIRSRAVGSTEEVKSVQNSFANNGVDGIGYTFFSFGNIKPLADSGLYGYIQLDGYDPIFASYAGSDPGQPGNGELPFSNVCGGVGFPCAESSIWSGKLSFPNLRNGNYSAWSLLRFVANTKSETAVADLISTAQTFVVSSVPDFVPAVGIPTGCTGSGCTDPGLQLFRAHYQQVNGDGTDLGPGPSDGKFNSNSNPSGSDLGGDMGGCIGSTVGGFTVADGVIQIGLDGGATGNACSTGPVR